MVDLFTYPTCVSCLDCRLNFFDLNLIGWIQLRRVGLLGKDPFWMGVMEDFIYRHHVRIRQGAMTERSLEVSR